jgi:hypothetical protein
MSKVLICINALSLALAKRGKSSEVAGAKDFVKMEVVKNKKFEEKPAVPKKKFSFRIPTKAEEEPRAIPESKASGEAEAIPVTPVEEPKQEEKKPEVVANSEIEEIIQPQEPAPVEKLEEVAVLVTESPEEKERIAELEAALNKIREQISAQEAKRKNLQKELGEVSKQLNKTRYPLGTKKSGYLSKKSGVKKAWQVNYFVVGQNPATLEWYSDSQDKQIQGEISLVNTIIYSQVEKKGELLSNFFNIRTTQGDMLLKAENKEDKEEWVKAIRSNVAKDASVEHATHITPSTGTFIGVVIEPKKEENPQVQQNEEIPPQPVPNDPPATSNNSNNNSQSEGAQNNQEVIDPKTLSTNVEQDEESSESDETTSSSSSSSSEESSSSPSGSSDSSEPEKK